MPSDSPLVAFLATRDIACPVCRYNLRGLQGETCPECAAPLRLDVASPNLHLGPLVLMIVAFSLAAGFDLVVGLVFVTLTLVTADPAVPASWIGPMLVGGTLCAVGGACLVSVVLLVRRRIQWQRLRPRRQWQAALVTFFGVGLAHAVLGAIIVSVVR